MNDSKVTTVILWQNGMLMVFDQHGEQMPEYQRPIENEENRRKLAAVFPEDRWERRSWSDIRRNIIASTFDGTTPGNPNFDRYRYSEDIDKSPCFVCIHNGFTYCEATDTHDTSCKGTGLVTQDVLSKQIDNYHDALDRQR